MLRLSVLCCPLFLAHLVIAQTTAYKFDFGSDITAKGYIRVTPETIFNYQTGYGFDQGSQVVAVNRGGDALTGDYITSTKSFHFSQMNYPVTFHPIWLL